MIVIHRTEGQDNVSNMFADGPPGTVVEENFMNSVQEEIAHVIEGASISLLTAATDTRDQLFAAILYHTGFHVITKTSSIALTALEMQQRNLFTNYGAIGEVILTLPVGVDGYQGFFLVTTAQYLRNTAQGTNVIQFGNRPSAAAGYCRSNEIGVLWRLIFAKGIWNVSNLTGLLRYDQ